MTREFLALAQAEFPPNQGGIFVPLFLEGGNGLYIGLAAATGVGRLARGACHRNSSKQIVSAFEPGSAPRRHTTEGPEGPRPRESAEDKHQDAGGR